MGFVIKNITVVSYNGELDVHENVTAAVDHAKIAS